MVNRIVQKTGENFTTNVEDFVIRHKHQLNEHTARSIIFNLLYVAAVLGCADSIITSTGAYVTLTSVARMTDAEKEEVALRAKEVVSGHSLLLGPLGLYSMSKKRHVPHAQFHEEGFSVSKIIDVCETDIVEMGPLPGEEVEYDSLSEIFAQCNLSNRDFLGDFDDTTYDRRANLDTIILNMKTSMHIHDIGAGTSGRRNSQADKQLPQSALLVEQSRGKSNSMIMNATHFFADMIKNNSLI